MVDVLRVSPEIMSLRVPAPLRDRPLWLMWAFEQHEGEAKPRKVPMYSMGGRRFGRQGSPEDRAKLTTFAVARDTAARRGLSGVGLALLPGEGLIALDFDRCVTDGVVDQQVLDLAAGTYAELSPSGTGIRAIFSGAGDILGNKKAFSDTDLNIEVFSTSGFVTFTGWALDGIDLLGLEDRIAPIPQRVITYCQNRFGRSEHTPVEDFTAGFEPPLNLSEDEIRDAVFAIDPDSDRDDWIRVGMALHAQHHGSEDGFALWDEWSADGVKYPGEEALRQQWDSFTRRAGPGQRQVTMASVLAMARDNRVPTAESVTAKSDAMIADLPVSHGLSTPPGFTGKYKVQTAASMAAQKPIDWLIKGVLPDADIGTIYGQSTTGKSFVALDMAMAIALGKPWRGHKVKQGNVVIIAAEGGGGFGKRIKAYCQYHGIDPTDLPLGIINGAPNLLEADEISEIAASLKAAGDVTMVIMDTLAQMTPGSNENASEDMGKALANAMTIRRVTGAMVILIHHAGKDIARGARGWSGLKGAMDVEIEVTRDEATDAREIRISKMKDEADGLRFGFKLENVVLGMDEDGDEYRSCVVLEAEVKPKGGAAKTSGIKVRNEWQLALLEAAESHWFEGMSKAALVDAAIPYMPKPEDGRDRRRDNLLRAVDALAKDKDGELGLRGNIVVLYK